jgi:shikimate dehydrogenase
MMYSMSDTPFVLWAKTHGASIASDGLGMLVEQAAESFFIWRGLRPETGSVIDLLKLSR